MNQVQKRQVRPEKETIHSGHFMVSHFEAEAQDDFDDLVTVPDEEQNVPKVSVVATYTVPGVQKPFPPTERDESKQHQQLSIEISLTKLFKCMTLAYRQKLTSPKWNRFKGIKLRWKDKIRLNNVIWRCWHMQFIKKQNTLVCQFASPLDVDTHVKPETTILEGKYWKRRAEAVIAEYKKWRKFHIMRLLGKGDTSAQDTVSDMDMVESFSQCSDLAGNMLTDEDYLNFMTDTLFSTITSHQPFAFPDCREIARGAGLADFIQPSLGPLQPNLDDFMDTLEPLQAFSDLLSTPRLPPVPEESPLPADEALYRSGMSVDSYPTAYSQGTTMPTSQMTIHGATNNTQMMPMGEQTIKNEQMRMYGNGRMFGADMSGNMLGAPEVTQYAGFEPPQPDQHMSDAYGGKNSRLQYVNATKLITQPEASVYNKYNAASVPPSQTAPETVSLLQQPVQTAKYASAIVIQGRPGYSRDKPRQRAHYPSQITNNHYTYGQGGGYEARGAGAGAGGGAAGAGVGARSPAPQMQYLQPAADSYKPKQQSSRSFKMPSPPASVAPQVVSAGSPGAGGSAAARKQDQYRSHSLPLGAQLNADWSVSAPAPALLPVPAAHDAAHRAPRMSMEARRAIRFARARNETANGVCELRACTS